MFEPLPTRKGLRVFNKLTPADKGSASVGIRIILARHSAEMRRRDASAESGKPHGEPVLWNRRIALSVLIGVCHLVSVCGISGHDFTDRFEDEVYLRMACPGALCPR